MPSGLHFPIKFFVQSFSHPVLTMNNLLIQKSVDPFNLVPSVSHLPTLPGKWKLKERGCKTFLPIRRPFRIHLSNQKHERKKRLTRSCGPFCLLNPKITGAVTIKILQYFLNKNKFLYGSRGRKRMAKIHKIKETLSRP